MQATIDQPVFTRRPMDIEDYLNIVRRNISWILGPTLAGLTIAVVVAFLWPDTYVSVARIRVVPPQVPERLLATNVNMQMAERVSAMTQTILSRTQLTNIIQMYDLYRKDRERLPMEDIVERMTKDVFVGNLQQLGGSRNAAAFVIRFSYENRYVAQRVTNELMTRFISENTRERNRQSEQTTLFFRDEYEKARADLDEIERRITAFRLENPGALPDQVGSTLSQVSALEARISTLNSSVGRANQEKLYLEGELRATREKLNQLQQLLAAQAEAGIITPDTRPGGRPSELDEQIQQAEREVQSLERGLERMLEQYTPEYPDVKRVKARLETARKERDALLNKKLAVNQAIDRASTATPGAPRRPAAATPRNREIAELEATIVRLQNNIRAKEMEAEGYLKEIAEAERRSREISSRLDRAPIASAQLEQLMRDYDLAKRRYDDLRIKVTQTQMARAAEERGQGETLEVLDNPTLPSTPTAPNRPLIIGAGVIIGFILGAGLAAFREGKDHSLKTLKDVRAYSQFNVLGSVPLLENDLVVRRRRRIAIIGWTLAITLSCLIMAGAVYYYTSTRL
jgi:polysaccharide chain length determinant protein (PEP-CTERM system associated)